MEEMKNIMKGTVKEREKKQDTKVHKWKRENVARSGEEVWGMRVTRRKQDEM
jgi:hypothetical protein